MNSARDEISNKVKTSGKGDRKDAGLYKNDHNPGKQKTSTHMLSAPCLMNQGVRAASIWQYVIHFFFYYYHHYSQVLLGFLLLNFDHLEMFVKGYSHVHLVTLHQVRFLHTR